MRTDRGGGSRRLLGFFASLAAGRVFRRTWACDGFSVNSGDCSCARIDRASGTVLCPKSSSLAASSFGNARRHESRIPPARDERVQFGPPVVDSDRRFKIPLTKLAISESPRTERGHPEYQ